MEGGGALVYRDGNLIKQKLFVDNIFVEELKIKTQFLVKKFPQIVLSADSFGRLTDRAIEFREMEDEEIQSIKEYFDTQGIKYSQSNVHLNFWCGEISKSDGVNGFMTEFFPKVEKKDCLFFY